jgi:uncharacterized protein (DUF305 family)
MKRLIICVAITALLFMSCTRRPVQKDIVVDHNSMSNSMSDHGQMMSSPNAAQAPYELQFIDTMIVHHQGAIDAAQLVATRGQHEELIKLAESIIEDQQREIAQMKEWRDAWYGGKPQAVNMDMPGMREGMQGMDLAKLDLLKANAFDLEFIRQMVPHHEGAVTMAKDALEKDVHPEVKALAQNIINAQNEEIEKMRSWQDEWAEK